MAPRFAASGLSYLSEDRGHSLRFAWRLRRQSRCYTEEETAESKSRINAQKAEHKCAAYYSDSDLWRGGVIPGRKRIPPGSLCARRKEQR